MVNLVTVGGPPWPRPSRVTSVIRGVCVTAHIDPKLSSELQYSTHGTMLLVPPCCRHSLLYNLNNTGYRVKVGWYRYWQRIIYSGLPQPRCTRSYSHACGIHLHGSVVTCAHGLLRCLACGSSSVFLHTSPSLLIHRHQLASDFGVSRSVDRSSSRVAFQGSSGLALDHQKMRWEVWVRGVLTFFGYPLLQADA